MICDSELVDELLFSLLLWLGHRLSVEKRGCENRWETTPRTLWSILLGETFDNSPQIDGRLTAVRDMAASSMLQKTFTV